MLWLLLSLNISTTYFALKKRMVVYAALMFFFLFLVIGQTFTIAADLEFVSSVSYRYADMTADAFHAALYYLWVVSLSLFLFVWYSRGYNVNTQPVTAFRFTPTRRFYRWLFFSLVLLSLILIFAVVGLQQFLTSSRPGFQSGSTIFIVLLILGLVPLSLKMLSRTPIGKWDWICASWTILITTGFSRIHDVLYAVILGSIYFYSRWADRDIPLRKAFLAAITISFLGSGFFIVGAIREAQNYTGGSLSTILSYILDRPDRSLLSLEQNYRIGVEGMSGLVGAMTKASLLPHSAKFDWGSAWILKGLTQWWPGGLKSLLSSLINAIDQLRWYSDSNVPSGLEESYTSFSWLGMFVFPVCFWLLGWLWPRFIVTGISSPRTKMLSWILIGCNIFFVRGSYEIWIGYLVSYAILLLIVWPLFNACIEITHASEGQA